MIYHTSKGFKVTTEDIVNLLTMESGGFDYWAEIDFERNDYVAARTEMMVKGIESTSGGRLCFEDVEGYMIETDKPIRVYDREEEKSYDLTLDVLLSGFELNFINRPEDSSMEDGDACTADCILQYAVFGEIVYA